MIVDCAIYEHGARQSEKRLPLEHAYEACRARDDAFVWIGLTEPTAAEFESLRSEFDLHGLAVEDAVKAHQRPKLEVYDETVFIVLKTARYVDHDEVVQLGEIGIFLGEGFVITVRHGSASDLHPVREELERKPELLGHGPGAVLHAIIDRVVDDYQPAIDGLAQDIEELEQQVFSSERGNPAERIYKLKREVLDFHRGTHPLVHPVDRLARGQIELIHPEVRNYFRDVNDHLLRVNEQLEGFRETLTSALTANLTQVGVRQNEDMRRISAWVAILAVPTAIAGIYGMNFHHIPELHWRFGYPYAIALMLAVCALLYRWFRSAGWL